MTRHTRDQDEPPCRKKKRGFVAGGCGRSPGEVLRNARSKDPEDVFADIRWKVKYFAGLTDHETEDRGGIVALAKENSGSYTSGATGDRGKRMKTVKTAISIDAGGRAREG